MRNKCALFKEANLYFNFKLRTTKRRSVENNRDKGAVGISERNAENENRPDFLDHAAVERQTSPRLGGTFLLIKHRGQLIASRGSHIIAEGAGIPRW